MIELQRQNGSPIQVNPPMVAAAFPNDGGGTIIRMPDGRGFTLEGSFEVLLPQLRENGYLGVDLTRQDGSAITIAPGAVAAVLVGNNGETIVRLPDGRGFVLNGGYAEVNARLGFNTTATPGPGGGHTGNGHGDVARGEDT